MPKTSTEIPNALAEQSLADAIPYVILVTVEAAVDPIAVIIMETHAKTVVPKPRDLSVAPTGCTVAFVLAVKNVARARPIPRKTR